MTVTIAPIMTVTIAPSRALAFKPLAHDVLKHFQADLQVMDEYKSTLVLRVGSQLQCGYSGYAACSNNT